MIDWVSLVLIALMIYLFGKAEFYKGILAERKDTDFNNKHSAEKIESDRYMLLFAIMFVLFLVEHNYPLLGSF